MAEVVLSEQELLEIKRIVDEIRARHENMNSRSAAMCRTKKAYAATGRYSEAFLKKLALSQPEYDQIRARYQTTRQNEALNVPTIRSPDALCRHGLQLVRDRKDPWACFVGLLMCTGMRPIELLRTAEFDKDLNHIRQGYAIERPDFWARQLKFAKRRAAKKKEGRPRENDDASDADEFSFTPGIDDTGDDEANNRRLLADPMAAPTRDRCFLCPAQTIFDGLRFIRESFDIPDDATNIDLNNMFEGKILRAVQRCLNTKAKMTCRILRRFFAAYALHFFPFINGTPVSHVCFAAWHLGHQLLEGQILAYHSLRLDPPHPQINLFRLNDEMEEQE